MQYTLRLDGRSASYGEVLAGWRENASCREVLFEVLDEAPYFAYFWEHPPLTRSTLDRPYEFVLIDAPALARVQPEPETFIEHFTTAGEGEQVVTFANLGRDAVLVVPRPIAEPSAYPHLAAFIRNAPLAQRHAFLCTIGHAMEQRLSDAPTWLSTAGLGVYWLHARLDSRPKYYRYGEYR